MLREVVNICCGRPRATALGRRIVTGIIFNTRRYDVLCASSVIKPLVRGIYTYGPRRHVHGFDEPFDRVVNVVKIRASAESSVIEVDRFE